MSKLLSIITVNFNGIKDTMELLDSIYANLHDLDFEVIVVDNASTSDDLSLISSKFPQVKLIESAANLGFAGGNNLGINIALGQYLFFINNDALLVDDSLLNLIKRMEGDSRIGAVSPKIRFYFGEQNIQFAGYTALSKFTLRNELIGFGQKDSRIFNIPMETPFLHGAAMMIRRDMIDSVGLMPEDYFLYYEELDWSEMIKKAGYILLYEPSALVFHKESQSTGAYSPMKLYYLTRNRLLFAKRNLSGFNRFISVIYQCLCVNFIKSILFLFSGKIKFARAITLANFDYFNGKLEKCKYNF